MSWPAAPSPWGWDEYTHRSIVPKPPPATCRWYLGPVDAKTHQPPPGSPGTPSTRREGITMQLTADQQVGLTISGEDRYGNPVDITGGTVWTSSDESIVALVDITSDACTAVAVGPAGTAAVTVSNDVNGDGTGDFQGSIAVDVVAGDMAEIEVAAAEPTDKPVVTPNEGR